MWLDCADLRYVRKARTVDEGRGARYIFLTVGWYDA